MSRIQSSIGLITGVPIQQTVDQLMQLQARPRDTLLNRTAALQKKQLAFTELTALVIGVQLAADKLGKPEAFEKTKVTSSNTSLISTRTTGTPAIGNFSFTPVRQAQSQQLLSTGVADQTKPLGAGTMSLRFGGFVDRGVRLEQLNGGAGVQRGKIRITDRSGASAVVDLRYAQTVDDVLQAINRQEGINVTAVADGDAFRLVDNTGLTTTNLKVQQVDAGSTAADLGLANVDVAASEAQGLDLLRLHNGVKLDSLNDGSGLSLRKALPDLEVTFRDGSSPLQIDFRSLGSGPGNASATTSAANGTNAELTFTAKQTGADYDDVRIVFQDDGTVTRGNESVSYDDSDPNNKTLTFNIQAGQTTANDIVAALSNDADASAVFSASAGGDGSGLVDTADTATTSGGKEVEPLQEQTLGDLLQTINAADPTRLQARISSNGDHLELIDLTSGSGSFSVSSPLGGSLAEDLGLTGSAAGGVLTSRRLQAGLKTTLLTSFNGGTGLGTLGQLSLTDRSGASGTIDLSAAETLDDVVQAINAGGLGIRASINTARNGIQLNDTTGATNSNLIVANGDGTNTADKLGLAADVAQASVNGGSLNLQVVSEHMQLADLNYGKGVQNGSFLITDSQGKIGAVNLAVSEAKTVGDVLEAINGLTIGVEARINATGDGIQLFDTAGGSGTLSVKDSGKGTAAADLKIAGTATTIDVAGTPTQTIDGALTTRIELDDDDTLLDLVDKINALKIPARASIFQDGSTTNPYRLSLSSEITGKAGELQIDASGLGLSFQEITQAQDALLLVGSADSVGAGILASSNSNTFKDVLGGVELTVAGTSNTPVDVRVERTHDGVVNDVKLFVEQFNKLRSKLESLTFFNEDDKSTGILFGSNEALRLETDFARLVTGRFFGIGKLQSLESAGVEMKDDGKLQFSEQKLRDQLNADADSVQEFFTTEKTGVAARLHDLAERLAGEGESMLLTRVLRNQQKIDVNNDRIDFMNARLEREREQLLKEFYNMEIAVGKLRSSMSALSALNPVPPITSVG